MNGQEKVDDSSPTPTSDIEKGVPSARRPLRDHPYGRGIGSAGGANAAVDEPANEVGSPSRSPSPSPPPSPPATKQTPYFEPRHPFLSTYSFLAFATIWGVLGRLGLEWIGGFAEREVFAVLWAQIVGCVVMGFVTERKKEVEAIFPPLFVMIGTGFCGSMTTWSSMANDTFVGFANLGQPVGTSRFAGFLSGVAITLVTLTVSMMALQFGVHLHDLLPRLPTIRTARPSRSLTTSFNLATILIGPVFLLGALFLLIFGPHSWRVRATFAIVFGPFGTLVRYELSRHLNPLNSRFPIGTLSANVGATLVFAAVGLAARRPTSPLTCAALKGLEDGFCASLSTISTFVVELRTLARRDSYRYFFATWALSELALVVVLGSWVWSGDRGDVCWT
ncbi:hypothetical protein JCM10212_002382 [Sporobolomyces blumeae]